MNKLVPITLSAAALLFIGCEAEVEEPGKMPDVDVRTESGQLPEYDVEQTQEGKMPDVDVDAEPGRLPEVDMQGPDVDVGRDTVEVPVPDIDVDMPNDNEQRPGQ